MSKPESRMPGRSLTGIISNEDLRAANELASSLILDKPRARFAAFTNSEALQAWVREKSDEVARLMHMGSADPNNTEAVVKEIVGVTLLEAFLVAYTFVSKLSAATSVGDDGAVQSEDFLKLELWERGLLAPKFYRFQPKGDVYLTRVKKKHRDIMALVSRVKKMKAVTGEKREK